MGARSASAVWDSKQTVYPPSKFSRLTSRPSTVTVSEAVALDTFGIAFSLRRSGFDVDDARERMGGGASVRSPNHTMAAGGYGHPRAALEQVVLVHVCRGGSAGGDPELAEDVAHVPFDGPLADHQSGSDLAVRLPGRDQPDHLGLAGAQHIGRTGRLQPGSVGNGTKLGEGRTCRVRFELCAVRVAEGMAGSANLDADAGFLIRCTELDPQARGHPQSAEGRFRLAGGEQNAAVGRGRQRAQERGPQHCGGVSQLRGGRAGAVDVVSGQADLDVGRKQPRARYGTGRLA